MIELYTKAQFQACLYYTMGWIMGSYRNTGEYPTSEERKKMVEGLVNNMQPQWKSEVKKDEGT